MQTPFTTEQFLDIFEKYNSAIFPFQILLIAGGLISLYFLIAPGRRGTYFTGAFTGLLWIWAGLVYHIIFFREINPVATGFGFLFILQGMFILYETFLRKRLIMYPVMTSRSWAGAFVILFGLVIYPLISVLAHNRFLTSITPGLPCPTLLYTFGVFLTARRNFPKYLFIVPVLWSILGISAAISLGVIQDFSLPAVALVTLLWSRRKTPDVQIA